MKKIFEFGYRLFLLIACGISVLIQFSPTDGNYNAHKFSFFTIQSNIFCFIILFLSLTKYYSGKNQYSQRFVFFKGMALSAIICTFLVYHFAEAINKYSFIETGVFGIPNRDLFSHYLIPFLFLLEWILFQSKGYFRMRYILEWLLFPIAYIALFAIRCICNSPEDFRKVAKFPYPFLNYEKLGIGPFAFHLFFIIIIMLVVNSLIIGFDLRKKRNES